MVTVISTRRIGRTVLEVIENRNLLGQRFHVRVSDINGHILLHSEKYRDKRDAQQVVNRIARLGLD